MTKKFRTSLLLALAALSVSCSRYVTESGTASYYGSQFDNRETASGSKYNPKRLTAAHKTLPFGTKVIVTNLSNHQKVKVRITDRGPFVKGASSTSVEKLRRRSI